MSKRTRNADNSKRQQPIQQQRAQARQLSPGRQMDKQAGEQPRNQAALETAKKQR